MSVKCYCQSQKISCKCLFNILNININSILDCASKGRRGESKGDLQCSLSHWHLHLGRAWPRGIVQVLLLIYFNFLHKFLIMVKIWHCVKKNNYKIQFWKHLLFLHFANILPWRKYSKKKLTNLMHITKKKGINSTHSPLNYKTFKLFMGYILEIFIELHSGISELRKRDLTFFLLSLGLVLNPP